MRETVNYVNLGDVKEGHQIVPVSEDPRTLGNFERSRIIGIVGARTEGGTRVKIVQPREIADLLKDPLVLGNDTPVFDFGRPSVTPGGRRHLQDTVSRSGGLRVGVVPIIGSEGQSSRGGPPGIR